MQSSNRLMLDVPAKDDLKRFFEIHSDPATNLFNPSGPMNKEKAEAAFKEILQHWEDNGFGVWTIKEKLHPEFIIGFGGLSNRLYGNELKLNVGYRFDKDHWGKGYATEVAQSTIHFGLHELNKAALFAIVRPDHLASIRVLEKCNMVLVDALDDVPGKAHSLIYIIEK